VRGTHIYNLFGQLWPPDATEIKKNRATVHGKNPENLQILKLQYVDFPDSILDDLFFKLGVFLRGNHIHTLFLQNFHKNILKRSGMSWSCFSSLQKKSAKIKNIFLQCLPRKVL
jgi:hypothetical protein